MSTREASTPCLAPEAWRDLLAGSPTPGRREFVEHIESCSRCRTRFATLTASPSGFLAGGMAVCAVLLALVAVTFSYDALPTTEKTRREVETGRLDSPRIELLEQRLAESSGEQDVLEALQRADSAPLLHDLAGAYLVRAETRNDPRDRLLALETAERAWRLDRDVESAWHRAVALERCGLRTDARAAWLQYLNLDATSERASGVPARLRTLDDSSRAWSRDELLAAFRAAFARGDTRALRGFAEQDPEQFRLVSEEVLLPEAAAMLPLRGERWAEVNAAATVLHDRGERLLADALAALDHSDEAAAEDAARAFDEYRRGRHAMKDGDHRAAFESFTAARDRLHAHRNPFALRAAVFRSTVRIYDGKAAEAVRLIDDEISRAQGIERWPLLAMQMYWVKGLGLAVLGEVGPALRSYAIASRFADGTRENASRAGLEQVVADALRDVGDQRQAWHHHLQAVSALDASVRHERKVNVLNGMVRAATLERFRLVPELVHGEVLRLAREAGDPLFLTSTLIVGAGLSLDRGDVTAAESGLREAESVWPRIPDSGMKLRVRADLDTTRYRVLTAAGRVPDIEALSRSLAVFAGLETRTRLAELHLLRAKAYQQRGDVPAARLDLERGLAELERQRAALTVDEKRSQAVVASALVDEAVRLELADGKVEAAFDTAERARARLLLERATGEAARGNPARTWREIRSRLADQTVLVVSSLLRDRLIVWTATNDGLTAKQVPIRASDVRFAVEALRRSVERDEPAFRAHAARLHEWMFGNASPPAKTRRVVFVPDSELFDVPFAALQDRTSGRYLVQDYAIAVAPSASLAVLPTRGDGTEERALVVGVAAPEGFEPLPKVRIETERLAALLRNASVLLEDRATVAAFEKAAPGCGVIHFAGHAIANPVHPARSGLVLGRGAMLTARQVSGMDLRNVRLVVLAACRTADGVSAAEAPLTMATAFLTAGASTTLATTLDADDGSVTRLLSRFHAVRITGARPEEALRTAQLEMLREPHFSAPRHWAAFSILGSSVAAEH